MGTRGIMGVRIDGQDKITYNHFDSYPSGLGQDVVDHLSRLMVDPGLGGVKKLARSLRVVNENDTPSAEDKERLHSYLDSSVGERSEDDWYCLTRRLQGKLTETLHAGVMVDGSSFALDSLYCEWGYIANLDDEVLEVYAGFQEERHAKGRFARTSTDSSGYYPIALLATFPIRDIPKDWERSLPGYEEEE